MKRIVGIVVGLASMLGITACTALLNASIPGDGYHVVRDVAYGHDPRQKFDIYVPDALRSPAPVVLFFYGGSWQYGSKSDYRFLGQALASKGIITVVADYRLYPKVYFPAFVEDGAQAFRFVHEHIAQYGGDPGRLYLAGHSAGAFIAVMLTANDQYLKAAHAKKSWIRGTIGISGPYDFLPLTDPKLVAIFSKQDLALTQPINFIHSVQPPMFLATGDRDDTVLPRNTHHVVDRLRALHSPVEEHIYPGTAHIGIILSLARGFRWKTPLLEDIATFVNNPDGANGP